MLPPKASPVPGPDASPVRDRNGLVVPLLLVVTAFAAFYRPVFAGQAFFFRDFGRWLYPARWFVRQSFEQGQSPFWNPGLGLGFATLADPLYAPFYPPNWLLLCGPLPWMLTALALLHLGFGATGIAVVSRQMGVSRWGAAIAAAAWGLSGFASGLWSAGVLLFAAAWIPWIVAALVRMFRNLAVRLPGSTTFAGRALGDVLGAALPLAMALLQGEIFVAAMSVGLGVAVAIACRSTMPETASPDLPSWRLPSWRLRSWRSRLYRLRQAVLTLSAVLLLAGACAAVALVPAVSALDDTARASGLPQQKAELWSLHPLRLLEIVAPGVLGSPYGDYPGGRITSEASLSFLPLMFSVYLGAFVSALALVAVRRRDMLSQGVVLIVASALLLSLGRHTPVHGVFRKVVPLFALMRYPEKYVLMVAPSVAWLAGLGACRLCHARAPRCVPWRRLLLALGSFLGALILVRGGFLSMLPELASLPTLGPALSRGLLHAAGFTLAALILALALPSSLAPTAVRWRALVRSGPALLLAGVFLDFWIAKSDLLTFGDADLLALPPVSARAVRGGVSGPAPARVFRGPKVDEATGATLDRFADLAVGQLALSHTLVPNTAQTFGVAIAPGYEAALPALQVSLLHAKDLPAATLPRFIGADFAVYPASRGAPFPAFLHAVGPRAFGSQLYRVVAPLPRVYVAGQTQIVSDTVAPTAVFADDILSGKRALLSPSSLTGPAAPPWPPGPPAGAPVADAAGACTVTGFANTKIEATCRLDRAGVVVFVEQFAQGWSAQVDGVAASIVRANVIMRAVAVEAGVHRITMTFVPPGLWAGAALTWMAFLFIAVAAVGRLVAGRRRATA